MKAVMIVFLCLSILFSTALSCTPLLGVEGTYQPAEETSGVPIVDKFLNTNWKDSISDEERAQILLESSSQVWSTPENKPYVPSLEDLNETGGEAVRTSSEKPWESRWPWQDISHQRKDFSALPRAPNMEGHYWLKKSYSTLSFDITIDTPISENVYIWIWLTRVTDIYTRYLTVWFDHNQADRFIVGSNGFKGCIYVPSSMIEPGTTTHMVELSMHYCGWVERGWKLEYCWVGIGSGSNGYQQTPPLDTDLSPYHPYPFTELVPRSGKTDTAVEYRVFCGPTTVLNIETENVGDSVSRVVDIYIDGTYKDSIASPGAYEIDLDDYARDVLRILKMVFKNMPDIDYPKRITQLAIHHVGWTFEIDVMPGVWQSTIIEYIASMNAWYKIHAYHRAKIWFSGVLADDYETILSEHIYYWTWFNEHKFQLYWEYVIWVKRLTDGVNYYGGWHYQSFLIDYGIAIAWHGGGPTTIWHEYGHHISILELGWGGEVYCSNSKCVMSTSTGYYYCWYHWHLRSYQ